MHACGVTIAGLINLKKKKPPIKEQILKSVASGYFLYIIIININNLLLY